MTLLAACTHQANLRYAKGINIVDSKPGSHCRYIGQITGQDNKPLKARFSSRGKSVSGVFHQMENRAEHMGANTIWMEPAKDKIHAHVHHQKFENESFVHGKAYFCSV